MTRVRSLGALATALAAAADEVHARIDRERRELALAVAVELSQLECIAADILAISTHLHVIEAALTEARLADLAQLCAYCGHERGDHLTDAPHPCESDAAAAPCHCPGYRPPGLFPGRRDTTPPAAPTPDEVADAS